MLDLLSCAASGQVVFAAPCPVGWEGLEETEDPRRRWCPGCSRSVFRCHDAHEAGLRAEQGECVAVPAWLVEGARERSAGVLILGRPDRVRLLTELVQERLEAASDGEHGG